LFYDISANSPVVLADNPIIITPNHKSFADHWIIALSFSRHIFERQIPFRFLGHHPEHFPRAFRWIIRFIWWAYGVVSIEKGESNTIQKLRTVLKEHGQTVIMYPEGTRVRDGSALRRFRLRIVRLHRESGAKILPVAIQFKKAPSTKILGINIPIGRRRCVVNFAREATNLPELGSLQDEADWLRFQVEQLYDTARESL
jgi:hypothetical protein